MMKNILISLLLVSSLSFAQQDNLFDAKKFQEELNEHYLNQETSVLLPEDFESFEGLPFFPLDEKYIVEAKLVRTPDEKPFEMPTTTERRPIYVKYGEAHFQLDGKDFVLNIFQPVEAEVMYLFIPFTDLTSGVDSYGGGRYLDFKIPEKDLLVIDFNKAYNPYCAYNPKYSCPIPPEENDLKIRIAAGVGFRE